MERYIVYKTKNKINGKFYIGVHKTKTPYEFDGYLGSGKILRRAIEKYGFNNFERKLLFVFEKKEDAFNYERQVLYEIKKMNDDNCYNLHEGGWGGFDYINYSNIGDEARKKAAIISSVRMKDKWKNEIGYREKQLKILREHSFDWRGVKHSKETRKKMSQAKKGKANPMMNKRWIYDKLNKKPLLLEKEKADLLLENKDRYNWGRKYRDTSCGNYGKSWIHRGKEEKIVEKNLIDSYLEEGWKKGRINKVGEKKNGGQ